MSYQGLFGVLSDPLIDKWGDVVFTRWMKDNHIKIGKRSLCMYLGSRRMGTLESEPSRFEGRESERVGVLEWYSLARNTMDQREKVILSRVESRLSGSFVKPGTSAGGTTS